MGPIFQRPAWLSYLFTRQLTAVPREVPELKVQSGHHQRENVDGGAPGGAGAEGPRASTINVKTSTAGPREVPELKVREHPPST
jgi:hypothetical protein